MASGSRCCTCNRGSKISGPVSRLQGWTRAVSGGRSASSACAYGRWGRVTTVSSRSGGTRRSARRMVCRSSDWVPKNVQYCLGRSQPKRARMKGCIRRPSPPARTMPQRWLCVVCMRAPPCTAAPGNTLPVRCVMPNSSMVSAMDMTSERGVSTSVVLIHRRGARIMPPALQISVTPGAPDEQRGNDKTARGQMM